MGEFHVCRFLPGTVLLACAPALSDAGNAGARGQDGLARARARIEALASGPANELGPFRPVIGTGEDPRPGIAPNVRPVRVTTPWASGETLWIHVPEHAWTRLPEKPAQKRLLFAGSDPSKLKPEWREPPFPQREPPSWRNRADGGIELESALAGGVSVVFQVLPGERMFEVRFGVSNSSAAPLLETWTQLCVIFRDFAAMGEQSPETSSLLADGALLGWGGAGQDLSWIDARRDPGTGLVARSCFFQALVQGCADERFPPASYQTGNVMWLRRTIDAPILVKSARDRRRHVVLYSPCGRTVMYNAVAPCGHVDPYMDGVGPGETRWVVLYGLFFEGELAPLLAGLVEADRVLRRSQGFTGE